MSETDPPQRLQGLFDEMQSRNEHSREQMAKEAGMPEVGIFWVVGSELIFDTAALSEADEWSGYKTYPSNHEKMWPKFQRWGMVPNDMDYRTPPRGRVGYDIGNRQFILTADRCILKDSEMLDRIYREMNLPENTSNQPDDEHYRCAKCR